MSELKEEYFDTRKRTVSLCEPLAIEDYVVQPVEEVSPPKWHLAHSTWFFEKFLLKTSPSYKEFHSRYDFLFNSYYETVGKHWNRNFRGALSRPTVKEILSYRRHVDEAMEAFFTKMEETEKTREILEIGIHHEKQHQELLLMDVKAILSYDPDSRAYAKEDFSDGKKAQELDWIDIPEGQEEFGSSGEGFAYDNERPRHKRLLRPAKISAAMVTNGEYLEFMLDGGYERPELWLSLGWDWVNKRRIKKPLYWEKEGDDYFEHTLYGRKELVKDWPVQHVSLFEAYAYAAWKKCRLPSEFEMEFAQKKSATEASADPESRYHSTNAGGFFGELWCWSSDQYNAYPGYQGYEGSLDEYNKKFMCNQFVLRGGSYGTPKRHFRPTYRNFFEPWQRWMFSGFRLAKDA